MLSKSLKSLAMEYNLNIEKGIAYGMVNGCFITLLEGNGTKQMALYIGKRLQEAEVDALSPIQQVFGILSEAAAADPKRFRFYPVDGLLSFPEVDTVVIRFQNVAGVMARMHDFMDNMLPQLAQLTSAHACGHCGFTGSSLSPVQVLPGVVVPMHDNCVNDAILATEAPAADEKPQHINTPFGILGAILGAAIGMALWIVVGKAGYIASLVGLVIAFLASKGYDLLHGRKGAVKLITVLICVVLAVIIGNIGVALWECHDVYAQEVASLKFGEVILVTEQQFIQMVLKEPDVISGLMKDGALGLFFAFLGSFGIIRDSAMKGGKQRIKPVQMSGRI